MANSIDTKVSINGEESYLIEFPVGDWSDDGHGKCHYYQILSSKPVREVREAHFKAKKALGIDIGSICKDYENNTLDYKLITNLKEMGYDFSNFSILDGNRDPVSISTSEVFGIWLFLLNRVNPSLKLRTLEIPTINFYGYDKKNGHLETPGYGCF